MQTRDHSRNDHIDFRMFSHFLFHYTFLVKVIYPLLSNLRACELIVSALVKRPCELQILIRKPLNFNGGGKCMYLKYLFSSFSPVLFANSTHRFRCRQRRHVYTYQMSTFVYLFLFTDKPICKSEQKRIFGVAKGEQVEIECKVDANPKAKEFRWAFNNSADSIDVPQVSTLLN